MIHRLEGKLYVELRINGSPVPDVGNFYNHMVMTEGGGGLIPACQMSVIDEASLLVDELSLSEGNTFSITVGVEGGKLFYTRDYRLFGSQERNNYQGPIINAVGVLDVPNFYAENVTDYYDGTSDAVLSKLAGQCGLKYNGPGATDDKARETWLCMTKTRAAFMNEVARHGYVDNLSFMAAAATSLKELRYKNITEVFRGGPVAKFSHNREEKGVIYVHESKDMSTAGMSDSWGNYGMHRHEHRLDGEHKNYKQMAVQKVSPFLPVNSAVSGQIGKRARVDYMLLDGENQHKKYWEAYYQNQRKLALMSEKVEIMVYDVTPVQLFDLVSYRQSNANIEKEVKLTDMYMVTGKAVVVKGGTHYAEKIQLRRYTLTKDGKSPLE